MLVGSRRFWLPLTVILVLPVLNAAGQAEGAYLDGTSPKRFGACLGCDVGLQRTGHNPDLQSATDIQAEHSEGASHDQSQNDINELAQLLARLVNMRGQPVKPGALGTSGQALGRSLDTQPGLANRPGPFAREVVAPLHAAERFVYLSPLATSLYRPPRNPT
jgi:hypothetical protein